MTADDDLLRLVALDAEDLGVLSAHAQDAVLKVADIRWLAAERRFVVALNRFAWEAGSTRQGLRRSYQRRRTALHFDRVTQVRAAGIDQARTDAVLELLAIRFEPADAPSGNVVLDFAGGATMSLAVECIEAQLADLGPAWSTTHAPRHALD